MDHAEEPDDVLQVVVVRVHVHEFVLFAVVPVVLSAAARVAVSRLHRSRQLFKLFVGGVVLQDGHLVVINYNELHK